MADISAVQRFKAFVEERGFSLRPPVTQEALSGFEQTFKVVIPADFKEYLKTGAGPEDWIKSLMAFHSWKLDGYARLEIHRFRELPGIYCEFADHSICVWGYVIHMDMNSHGNHPVYVYNYGMDLIPVADSFSHFLDLWLALPENELLVPQAGTKSIPMKGAQAFQVNGSQIKDAA